MNNQKKILLLGGSAQQIIAIETAKRLGLYTVLCDYLSDNPGQFHADRFYQTSTTDREAVLNIAKKENIDYIIAYASDPAAPTAAYVAEALGLPTNPYSAVTTLCNKDIFREFLRKHGFNTPHSCGYSSKQSAIEHINDYTFPIIVKPVDSSGSKGATVLHNVDNLEKAIEFAFSFSRCHRIIIEEFIEKKHPFLIGGDIFVSKGKIVQWGLMNCHRDNHVNPLVPVGKSYPPMLEEEDLEKAKKELQKLITELGINFGPLNVELIIDSYDRVFLIDIGPRSGGNMIPDLLGMIFDCDVVEMSVRSAMGEDILPNNCNEHLFYATLNLHSNKNGTFVKIDYDEIIQKYIVRKNIYVKPGDEVRYFSNSADALGIVFFKFSSQDTMISFLGRINDYIHVISKP